MYGSTSQGIRWRTEVWSWEKDLPRPPKRQVENLGVLDLANLHFESREMAAWPSLLVSPIQLSPPSVLRGNHLP